MDLPLAADLVEAASDLSVVSMLSNVLDPSDFALPGIFDFIAPRIDLEDSFVSDLLIEGYAWRVSDDARSGESMESPVGVLVPSLDLDDCCPILGSKTRSRNRELRFMFELVGEWVSKRI